MTVKSRGIIYELGQFFTKGPIAIDEIPAMHHLLDCQNYVEAGIKLNKVKNKVTESDVCYQLIQEIEANYTGSFYFLRCSQNQHHAPEKDKT